jgi:hypothetical protein
MRAYACLYECTNYRLRAQSVITTDNLVFITDRNAEVKKHVQALVASIKRVEVSMHLLLYYMRAENPQFSF